MKISVLMITGAISLLFTGCAPKTDNATDVEALRKLTVEDWGMNAMNGNVDAMADSYTEDAVRIGDGVVMNGREEIRSTIKSDWRLDFYEEVSNTVEDIMVSGDLAMVRGWFHAVPKAAEGRKVNELNGAWVDVCERQENGEWKMILTLATGIGEGNIRIAEKYHELNPDNIDDILADDFTGHNEKNRMNWTKEEHRNYLTNNRGVIADQIFHQLADGDWVATWFERTGELEGEKVSFEMMHFKRFEDGKIAELWEYGDTQQLETE